MLLSVKQPDFEARLTRLDSSLQQVADLFRGRGEKRWLEWATQCQSELRAHEAGAFGHILNAFGGMGSLNDLLILRINGHVVDPVDETAVNDRLDALRSAIWDDATALRRGLHQP